MGIINALDQEWRELVDGRSETVIRWAERHPVLAPCQSLTEVLTVARLNSDPVLAALLTEVLAGDRLAGRVVLQALLGRMVRMAQRDPRSSVDDYLACLWCVINRYPLQRRPLRIAANLSMDTLNAVWRERSWPGGGEITLWPSGEALEDLLQPAGRDGSSCDALPPIDVEVHRVLEVGSSLRLIDDADAALLRGVYADGMTGDQAARRFHTSAGVVRVRCSKAVRRLAAYAVELANAA
jgi:hypothetical protein